MIQLVLYSDRQNAVAGKLHTFAFTVMPPAGDFLPIAAERFTVVSAGFQPRCGMETGTLPRNHLASSATGGDSVISV